MKIAIVHDWLVGGGAEKVVEELHNLYPDAPIYTSYCTPEWRQKLDNKVITGYLQYWPFGKLRKYLPLLRSQWFRSLDLSKYDVIISSSGNGEAKQITKPNKAIHVCYCHSPTHFYWRHYDTYLKNPGFGILNPLARLGLKLLVGPLRKRDYQAAQRVDYFIANSTHIQSDIKQFYKRDSVIIHPPVDIERFATTPNNHRIGYVTLGRQTPYKRTEVLIEACNILKAPLLVIGRGPEHNKLVKIAGPTIRFASNALDNEIPALLSGAQAFLFAAEEDFGIAPVEALATGTPVVAFKAGGALDYITDKTGAFFLEQTPQSLVKTLNEFHADKLDAAAIRKFSKKFSVNSFRDKVDAFINNLAKN